MGPSDFHRTPLTQQANSASEGWGTAGKQPRWGQYFTAGGLAQLASLTGLRRLSIQGCNWSVGAWKLAALSCLSRLEALDVSQPDVRRSNFDSFALAAFPLFNLQVPRPFPPRIVLRFASVLS